MSDEGRWVEVAFPMPCPLCSEEEVDCVHAIWVGRGMTVGQAVNEAVEGDDE